MTKQQADELLIRKDGTIRIAFDSTTIELGQIRTGQLKMLKEAIDEIRDRIVQLSDDDKAAKDDVDAFNAEHADEEGFEPKEFVATTVVLLDYYAPWLRQVVETLGTTNARLPEDTETWPVWLSQGDTLSALFEAWRFNPLVRGA